MARWLALIVILVATAPLGAAVDREIKTPYDLRVVLRIADHPHFTDYFRRELRRELQGQLQAALGNLGTVEVVDQAATPKESWPPLWKLADDKGLEALDGFNDVGGGKTHFLRVDFVDGSYDLRARQHDGASGFVTPLVRSAQTHDRGDVVRLAGLMIGRDFGLIATLDPIGAGEHTFITAKGGALGPLDHWVKPGEVFAVVAIRSERRQAAAATKGAAKATIVQTGRRVDGVLLQVTAAPRDGVIPCRMFHRYDEPLPRGALGYRCVKLGTTTAPLRLRLLDAGGAPQKNAALQVFARAVDFPDGDKEAEQAINHDGVFVSRRPFANVAFVRVLIGNRRVARIPVELLDDRVEARTITLDPGAEVRDRLDAERRGLLSRLTDGRLIQVRCFQDITALEQAGKKAEALERALSAGKVIDGLAGEIQEDLDKLQARAVKEMPKAERFAGDCAQQLQILRAKQQELRQHLEDLRVSIAQDNDPLIQEKKKRVLDLIRSAELLVTQAEYDKALAKYEEAMAAAADEPAAKQRIEGAYRALKKAWEMPPGDAPHADARKFINETWPKLGALKDVRDQLPAARKAFEKCRAAGDRLAVNKMHLSAVEVVARFSDELKKLVDAAMEDEELKTVESYRKVSENLQKLLKDVQDYLLAGQKK
jgi:tetratricopeptide (TPR) repeat protein